jgi:hypothetical protein
MPWDSSLDTFLCACDGQGSGQGPDSKAYLSFDSFPSAEQEIYIPETNSVSPTPSSVADQNLALTCMWGNCQSRFASLSDLVGHVNLEHLRLPSSSPSSSSLSASPSTIQSDGSPMSCLWRNCTVYSAPESIPTSSSSDPVEGLLGVLANHLLHDHLGHHLPPTTSKDDPPAFFTNANQQNWNKPSLALGTDHSNSPSPSPSHQCSGTHKCNWKLCGQSFTTCSDLTSHITAEHVGGGKAHYECFWEGCSRNGSNGFSSKQKISRHLQASFPVVSVTIFLTFLP